MEIAARNERRLKCEYSLKTNFRFEKGWFFYSAEYSSSLVLFFFVGFFISPIPFISKNENLLYHFVIFFCYSVSQTASPAVMRTKKLPLPPPTPTMMKMRTLFSTIKDYKDPKGRQLSVIFNKLPSKIVSFKLVNNLFCTLWLYTFLQFYFEIRIMYEYVVTL